MTFHSDVGILHKHAQSNWFDETYLHFERQLELGRIAHTAIPGWFLVRTYCVDCDESCTAIRYHSRRILLQPSGTEQLGRHWVIHQCPPDDQRWYSDLDGGPQYDGSGNPV